MKQIINNKIYDTETAELIYEYRHFKYYKYIENDFNYQDRERIEPTTLENIKELIKELNPDKFIELFGKIDLEEA